MNKQQAEAYISFGVDDALTERDPCERPANCRLVGWQCGFEPLFIAVWSYLPHIRLDDIDAIGIATDLLDEKKWFANGPTDPDYVL